MLQEGVSSECLSIKREKMTTHGGNGCDHRVPCTEEILIEESARLNFHRDINMSLSEA